MNALFRLILFGVAAVALAIYMATEIGNGGVAVPIVGGLAFIGLALMLIFGKKMPLDAMVLLVLIIGFGIGGRGFAYQRFGSILFITEVSMAFCLIVYFARVLAKNHGFVPGGKLGWPFFAFLTFAGVHLFFDYRTFGIMAMRDACMAYYVLFFFLSYQIAVTQPAVAERMIKVLLWSAPVIFIFNTLCIIFPKIVAILVKASIRGVPLFLPHGDACAAIMFGSFFACAFGVSHAQGIFKKVAFYILAITSIGLLLVVGRGALFVAFAFAFLILALCRQWKFVILALIPTPLIVAVMTMASSEIADDVSKTFDRSFQQLKGFSPESIMKGEGEGGTILWRITWWKKLTTDVTKDAPLKGFGWGADISSDFVREWQGSASDDHSRVRGAHNAFFTILARLGYPGVFLFLVITFQQLVYFWKLIKAHNRGLIGLMDIFLWGGIIVGFVITFVQYTWEACYTAVPFWVMSGLAYARLDLKLREESLAEVEEAPVRVPSALSRFRPAAS